MKTIAAVVLSVALLVSPAIAFHAATLPWATFSASAADSVGAGIGSCPQGEIVRALLRHGDTSYVYFYAPDTNVWLIYEPESKTLWSGKVDVANNDALVPSLHRKATESELEVGPCPLLFPKTT